MRTPKGTVSTQTRKLHFSGSWEFIMKNPSLPLPPLFTAMFPKATSAAYSLWCFYHIPWEGQNNREEPDSSHQYSEQVLCLGGKHALIKVCHVLKEVFCIVDFILRQHQLSDLWTLIIVDAHKTLKNSEKEGKMSNQPTLLLNNVEMPEGDPNSSS